MEAATHVSHFPFSHTIFIIIIIIIIIIINTNAMFLRPFMDVIWTTANQPGNNYHAIRHNIELQAIGKLFI